jgi:peroxiredoxin
MRISPRVWIVLLAVSLIGSIVGCPPPAKNGGPKVPPPGTPSGGTGETPGPENTVAKPPEPVVPPPPTIPKVNLTESLAATCLVKVGDAMPETELPAPDGTNVPLKSLFGQKATVLFFCNSKNEYSMGELADLTAMVVEPYSERGIRVVGIDVGDTPEVVAQQIEALGVKFPVLLDPNGEYFAKVASEKVTRTYLLDAAGSILWFDMEYSVTTRNLLGQALRAVLEPQ